ncbi:Geranylgeranyl pyrophosphate synthetase, putative [Penicillium digitatum]|uniref:Geranylgeranyl pyrophosphate synthetase, putative n=3 Tax=Penicillium digitatum TaxID=36651 RepID=K9F9V8_PEND2|nr:Geranylgeranyl pyrophosphate synthetase, putative [Penicillium digitatum Pd1]EKV06240.1 Geranylgeranyl pyrophosphate synthetase, putative [Penicillium digitatum PHI26]EKV18674.1 Geranylgeranyl pyrophosphate synthetase, putative [Penicillium digitatum Pd1]QQK47257.1 Geranylgeranyl pyrophosphate synthetase, putative [Penicillium digitatum]
MNSTAFQPPSPVPPRTSSANAINGTGSPSHQPKLSVTDEEPTKTAHSGNKSSMDDTQYEDGTWSSKNDKILMGPYDYVAEQPGKDIRRQLIHAFNAWLQVPPASLATITKVVTMLHTASLLIDDVEDNSVLRRGIPVAHNIFGTAQTINSANYVYFLALQEVQQLKNPAAIEIYVQEMLNLHRGQGMDLFWRDTLTCPTEDEYLEMVGNKTGGLFRLAVKLMQAESPTEKNCVALVNVMGLIFQICDDYLNLSNTVYTENKGFCEDLTEGKFSFPIIHSIRSNPSNHQLINLLKQNTKDVEVKRYAVQYMKNTGSFAHTCEVVADLRDQAFALIEKIDAMPKIDGAGDGQMVRAIVEKIVESTLSDSNAR